MLLGSLALAVWRILDIVVLLFGAVLRDNDFTSPITDSRAIRLAAGARPDPCRFLETYHRPIYSIVFEAESDDAARHEWIGPLNRMVGLGPKLKGPRRTGR
jgi:hypothetical protein